jgi:hypothetical protein
MCEIKGHLVILRAKYNSALLANLSQASVFIIETVNIIQNSRKFHTSLSIVPCFLFTLYSFLFSLFSPVNAD